jgi:hypothetical protein
MKVKIIISLISAMIGFGTGVVFEKKTAKPTTVQTLEVKKFKPKKGSGDFNLEMTQENEEKE